jgi:hypothetical protein
VCLCYELLLLASGADFQEAPVTLHDEPLTLADAQALAEHLVTLVTHDSPGPTACATIYERHHDVLTPDLALEGVTTFPVLPGCAR